ncbi:hypothetical protein E8E12_006836 [Didymella heteroderae]|uniref:Uncharacterized protein n=1 Tax=Didymella heteroderae TaxID=1769908 RepID=A0A9P5C178_9PLEO|nr:hypothetical protein E8E12_006836 [Didymella heteroderae]
MQSRADGSVHMSKKMTMTFTDADVDNVRKQLTADKHKREEPNDSNDAGHMHTAKKQRANHSSQERPKRLLPDTCAEPSVVESKSTASTTTPNFKDQHRFEPETVPQLPTPPSSNDSPKHDSNSGQTPKIKCIPTPTPAEMSRSDQIAAQPIGAESTKNRKRRRDGNEDLCEGPKRAR